MLAVRYSHDQYQDFVCDFLTRYYISTGQQITIVTRSSLVTKLWGANLTGIVQLIKNRYSRTNRGTPPKDAVAMFRSLILMTLTGETSIPKWVDSLRSDPFLAVLSGFLPACFSTVKVDGIPADPIPGVGTFYDYMDRLIRKDRILYKSKLRKFKHKPKKKQKKNQKLDSSKPGVVERLVNRVLKYDNAKLPDNLEATLNQVLKDVFVRPSLASGILGDPNKLNVAADGTCMPTHASYYGKKVCDCKLKPGERCDCPRFFADPTASWGWDSYNERYFYGHTFHGFTACDSFYSLPIHIKCVTGERHDSVTGVYELKELVDLYPEVVFNAAVYDSAYDANAFYLLNMHYGIKPVIDLNSRAAKPDAVDGIIEFDKNGVPRCKLLGHQLRNWGLMSKSYRRKWLFPVQCDACDKCHLFSDKTFYAKTSDNPRYFTPILRGSDEWKQLYKRRSTTERTWDRINNDFHAEAAVVLSRERRVVRVFLGAFCCFIDAWANESTISITDIFPDLSRFAA